MLILILVLYTDSKILKRETTTTTCHTITMSAEIF